MANRYENPEINPTPENLSNTDFSAAEVEEKIKKIEQESTEESEKNFENNVRENVEMAASHSEQKHNSELDKNIIKEIINLKNEGAGIIKIAESLEKKFGVDLEYTTPLISAATIEKHWQEKEKGTGIIQENNRKVAKEIREKLEKNISKK